MTITWPTTGTIICDGDNAAVAKACGPDGMDIQVAPGLIERLFVNGGGPKYEGTGNDPIAVSFRVSILCADAPTAAALCASIAATARVGTLTFSTGLTVLDAGLKSVHPIQNGRRVTVAYSFAGHL